MGTKEHETEEADTRISSEMIESIKKETDEEMFAEDIEVRQHKALVRSQKASSQILAKDSLPEKITDKQMKPIEPKPEPKTSPPVI